MDKIKRIKELTSELNRYRNAYYNASTSIVTDYQYDQLFDELQKLEAETGFILATSPTQTVGYEIKTELQTVRHKNPMLSLDKTKSIDDLIKFTGSKDPFVGGALCILSTKCDGISCKMSFCGGHLIQASSRGNSIEGQIITHNAKVVKNLPQQIKYKEELEIEGELIITYSDFKQINAGLPEDERYSNPRNLASGSAMQLNSEIAAKRQLRFVAWKVNTPVGEMPNSFASRLMFIKNLGFDIVPYRIVDIPARFDKYIEELKETAADMEYPIDGLVLTYDDVAYGESLGITSHHPKHSIAFKFYDEEINTRLIDIEWTMGKKGALTPTAVFDSVSLEGTIINRASLHNVSICKNLQLGIGDEITVYKANAIIPQVRDNLTRSNTFTLPDVCPICGGMVMVVKENNTETLWCMETDCKGKMLGKLNHFVSKHAINITGLSEQTLERFIHLGWLNTFNDIYRLHEYKEEMLKMNGFGKKSVEKLLENIKKSRKTTLDKFIYGLCIPLIGQSASKTISAAFRGDVHEFFEAWKTGYDFSQLTDFGENMNHTMHIFISKNAFWIEDLIKEFTFPEITTESCTNTDTLKGMTFVITGSLTQYPNRDALVADIERFGGDRKSVV